MKWKSVLCLVLIWSGNALGQSVTLPPEVKGGVGAWIIIAPEKIDGGKPRWRIDPGLQEVRLDLLLPPEQIAMLRGKVVTANKAGRFKIEAWNAKADVASDISTCWVVIGEPGPVPPDPKPPEPKPPEPKPPDVAPIPVDGFRVLIIHESADKITPAQRAIVTAQAIRQYVNAKCVKGPDGVTAEARFWDKDTVVSGESKLWQDAMNRPRTSVPWIIISTGKAGYEGPLPATVTDTLALLKKYGGE
jgi:hypothetical protein